MYSADELEGPKEMPKRPNAAMCRLAVAAAMWCAAHASSSPLHGQAPPAVRIYESPRANPPPAIDGDLADRAWHQAPWTVPFVDIRGDDWPAPQWATRARILWDDTHLYIAAELEEPHLWATLADRDAILYREHDFEVFIDPDGDALAYYELEINALGTEFDLFLDRPYQRRGKANIGWDMAGLRTAVRRDGTLNDPSDEDVGWSIEIAIPWSALVPPAGFTLPAAEDATTQDTADKADPIRPPTRPGTSARPGGSAQPGAPRQPGAPPQAGTPPKPGDTWRINFSRVQWPLEVVGGEYRRARAPTPDDRHPEHNWVWSPQGEINMHIPERWGVVRFVIGESR